MEKIQKFLNAIRKIITAILGVVMATLLIATTWQVVSRYVSASPQMWPTDIAAYGLVFLTYIGMGVLLRDDGHTRVDILYMNLSDKGKRWLDIIMDIVGLVTLAIMTYFSFRLELDYIRKETMIIGSAFKIYKSWVFCFIPVGLFFTTIEFFIKVIGDFSKVKKKEQDQGTVKEQG